MNENFTSKELSFFKEAADILNCDLKDAARWADDFGATPDTLVETLMIEQQELWNTREQAMSPIY